MFKKLILMILAITMVVIAAATVSQPVKAGAETFRYSFVGMGADASFSTCNYWPVPAGVVCTDTFITVAEQVYKEDGTKYPSTTMWFNQYQYKFDKKGNWIFVSDSWGYGDATLSIDRKLSGATASASLLVTTCTQDRRGNYNCAESIVPVSASWTGYGDIVRTSGNWHSVSKGFTYNSHFSGTYRNATAEISGLEAGSLTWASLFNSRWMDVYVNRGGW